MSDLKAMYSTVRKDAFPETMTIILGEEKLVYEKRVWTLDQEEKGLRYGENPDQPAALYALKRGSLTCGGLTWRGPGNGIVSALTEAQMIQAGKHPGKTNLTDVDNGANILQYLAERPAAVILKHNNPCGAAWADDGVAVALERAFWCDRIAAFGGAVGSGMVMALQFGCARGLFSNESGLGTAPIVAAAAKTKNPADQALISMTGAFWSTGVICLLTGLVLVSTMIVHPEIGADILANPSIFTGAALASAAFAEIPVFGTPVLVLGMCAFAYSTILGWSYYGNRCVAYLFGPKGIKPYQVIYVAVAFFGAIGVGDVVWTISDIGNALMAIPNIIVILLLSGMIARETKHYVYDGHLDEEYAEPVPRVDKAQL